MAKKREKQKVIWAGPLGELKTDDVHCLLHLLDDLLLLLLCEDQKTISKLKRQVNKAYLYLRDLYAKHELTSDYHTLGHNFVTAVTAIRAFIGALKTGKTLTCRELKILSFTALFHDTGYLRDSRYSRKADVGSHSARSKKYIEEYLRSIDWPEEDIAHVVKIQSFTHYTNWSVLREKIQGEFLAKLLVGADFLQVVDLCYPKNLTILSEILCTRSQKGITAKSQRKFYKLAKDTTKWIWKYLDAYYESKEENPYRKLWNRQFKRIALNYDKFLENEAG